MTATCRARDAGSLRVVVLAGEVDLLSAPGVAAELPGLLEGASAAVLDLRDVSFFDSSGLRLVDVFARACQAVRVPWRVVAPPGSPARRVLELVGLAGSEVLPDLATARQQLR